MVNDALTKAIVGTIGDIDSYQLPDAMVIVVYRDTCWVLKKKKCEEINNKELTPAPVYPLIVGVSLIGLLLGMPRLKDLYQGTIRVSLSGSMASAKKEMKRPTIRKKTY